MDIRIACDLPRGWVDVPDWKKVIKSFDVFPTQEQPPESAKLYLKPTSMAMIFIAPLRLRKRISPAKMIGMLHTDRCNRDTLQSPVDAASDGSCSGFSWVNRDGMTAGKIAVRHLDDDDLLVVVVLGIWMSDGNDDTLAEYDLIVDSLRPAKNSPLE
jgi:hypothetical protein